MDSQFRNIQNLMDDIRYPQSFAELAQDYLKLNQTALDEALSISSSQNQFAQISDSFHFRETRESLASLYLASNF